jgi:hypothetical protein
VPLLYYSLLVAKRALLFFLLRNVLTLIVLDRLADFRLVILVIDRGTDVILPVAATHTQSSNTILSPGIQHPIWTFTGTTQVVISDQTVSNFHFWWFSNCSSSIGPASLDAETCNSP